MEDQLTGIARRGLDAATELIERFAALLDDDRIGAAGMASAAGDSVEAVGRAWADVVRTTAAAWTGVDAPTGSRLDVSAHAGAAAGATVVLTAAGGPDGDGADPATSVTGELWLHNPTDEDLPGLAFVVSPLWPSSAGTGDAPPAVVPAASVALDPDRVELVPARSSVAVAVTVALGGQHGAHGPVSSGRYRGIVQVDGRDELWALLDLTVR